MYKVIFSLLSILIGGYFFYLSGGYEIPVDGDITPREFGWLQIKFTWHYLLPGCTMLCLGIALLRSAVK